MRILVAEDDFLSRRLIKKLLEKHGDVEVAVDGDEAFEAYKLSIEENAIYDIIFLDIMMPRMSGQEVLQKIRDFEKNSGTWGVSQVKIIMTTALDDFENVKKAFHGLVDGYLTKPISKEKIVKELEKLNLA